MRRFIVPLSWIQIGWLVALVGCATSQPSHFMAWTINGDGVQVEGETLALFGGSSVVTEKAFDSPTVSFEYRLAPGSVRNAVLSVSCVTEDDMRSVLVEIKEATASWASVSTESDAACRIELDGGPAGSVWKIRNFVVK